MITLRAWLRAAPQHRYDLVRVYDPQRLLMRGYRRGWQMATAPRALWTVECGATI